MNIMNVEFQVQNIDFLLKALEALNLKYNYSKEQHFIEVGQIFIDLKRKNVECNQAAFNQVNRIKRQYSREVITEIAKKKRWIVKQNSKYATKLQLKKY